MTREQRQLVVNALRVAGDRYRDFYAPAYAACDVLSPAARRSLRDHFEAQADAAEDLARELEAQR